MRCVCPDLAACYATVVAMRFDGSGRNVAWIRKDCGAVVTVWRFASLCGHGSNVIVLLLPIFGCLFCIYILSLRPPGPSSNPTLLVFCKAIVCLSKISLSVRRVPRIAAESSRHVISPSRRHSYTLPTRGSLNRNHHVLRCSHTRKKSSNVINKRLTTTQDEIFFTRLTKNTWEKLLKCNGTGTTP